MKLNQKIIAERQKNGFTQQELADLIKVNTRTIQRIESGESLPRKFTLKAMAAAFHISLEELTTEQEETEKVIVINYPLAVYDKEDTAHFLNLFCISCFSYLLLPYIHFLIPNYLLKKRKEQNPKVLRFANKVIRAQVYWVIATVLVFLSVLFLNFILRFYFKRYYINYLFPFFAMYFLNTLLIIINLRKIRILDFQ